MAAGGRRETESMDGGEKGNGERRSSYFFGKGNREREDAQHSQSFDTISQSVCGTPHGRVDRMPNGASGSIGKCKIESSLTKASS